MRHQWLFAFAFTACFAMAGIAEAQDKPVNFSLGGGYTAPNAEVRDHLGDGYNFNIGLQFNVTPVVGIEGLYSFNGLGEKRISIPVSPEPGGSAVPTDFFANMNMQFFDVNLVLQKPEGSVRPYGLVGMGVYYRPIEVTTPGVGYIPPILRSVVVCLLPRRVRSRGQHRRRAQFHRFRNGLWRRREVRRRVRRVEVSLHLGSGSRSPLWFDPANDA